MRGSMQTAEASQPSLTFADVLQICEFRTKIVSTSSVLIGSLAAAVAGRFSWMTFALFALGAFFVDIGTASFNSYFDFRSGVDTRESDHEKMKALVQRGLDPNYALTIALVSFAIAAAFGLVLGARLGWELVGAGAVCMLVAFFYSAGPRPLSSTAVGELFAGGVMGAVLLSLASYAQLGRIDASTLLLGVPSTLFIAAILTVNNSCDIVGDTRAGRRTLSILLGAERARRVIDAELALGCAFAFALIPLGVVPLIALLPLSLSALVTVRLTRRLHARGYTHATKAPSMADIGAIFAVYSLAILASLALRLVTR